MRPKCAEIAQHVRQTKKQDAKHIPGLDRFCPSALLHANKVGDTVGRHGSEKKSRSGDMVGDMTEFVTNSKEERSANRGYPCDRLQEERTAKKEAPHHYFPRLPV